MNRVDIEKTFKDLHKNKKAMQEFYNLNLKKVQLDLISTKNILDSYDPKVIKRIEKWISETDNISSFDPTSNINLNNGINIDNLSSGNSLYEEYLSYQTKYTNLEKKINKYSKKYQEMRELDEELKNTIIKYYEYLINEVMDKYFNEVTYDEEKILELGHKALLEAIDTYKDKIRLSFSEYAKTIITNYLKNTFRQEYGYKLKIYRSEITKENKEYLIKKLINMLKTNMSIYDMYNFLNINKYEFTEDTVNKTVEDLKNIIEIYSSEEKDNIKLVCNIYEIDKTLAEYIYDNRLSIIDNISSFLEYNKF